MKYAYFICIFSEGKIKDCLQIILNIWYGKIGRNKNKGNSIQC